MSVSTSDLITSIRQRSNTQRSRFVLDAEILGFANDSIADLYDLIVTSREDYFVQSSTFELPPGSHEISLVEATTGVSFVAPFPYEITGLTLVATGNTIDIAAPDVGVSPKYRVRNFTVTPTLANLGQSATLTLAVNGVATTVTVTVPEGSSDAAVDATHFVDVIAADTLSIITAQTDPLLPPGSDWGFKVDFDVAPSQGDPPFYKELALSYGGADPREVPRLGSVLDRFTVHQLHFWIQGQTLFFYPESKALAGQFTLDYVPNCPVLADGDELPAELTRFLEFILVSAAIAVKTKRQQPIDELSVRYAELRTRVIAAVIRRQVGPKRIPMPARERERAAFGRGCRGQWR